MITQKNVLLSEYSSFHCGGAAEALITCESSEDICVAVRDNANQSIHCLGFGTNVLISEQGLPGITLVCRGGTITHEENVLIAEAGVWWDDLVTTSIEAGLWGLELTSGIPSSIGGGVMGNIAAYGQQVSDTLEWIEVIATGSQIVTRIPASELKFGYRHNSLKDQTDLIIIRAGFKLSSIPTQQLEYGSALRIAEDLNLSTKTLTDRRTIILEARKRAGSLYDPTQKSNSYTAGSFFKNPVVPIEVAKKVITFDETKKSAEVLLKQNQIHGGSDHRVSAAHVLLAAGFTRGQTWGNVRLHPEHILKIENIGSASAQEIYDVAQIIISTVKEKLNITLEPEVQFLGDFTG
ncbi:FAD-binding protein [Candidatus Saccharibacteria bacterium]|nr:FAD-binding protein [Candidatus Saccharibacteria bacterium]